jgi:hypothetical protein
MAASTARFPVASVSRAIPLADTNARRRRRISRDAGRGLQILGHAIEYLSDEYVYAGTSLTATDARVKAIQILMALNREIYFACPSNPTLSERFGSWMNRRTAWLRHPVPPDCDLRETL